MDDRTYLVLGGAGLVGYQVAYRIATELQPDRLVIAARTEASVARAVAGLRELAPPGTDVLGEWGDVFLRTDYARTPRPRLLETAATREAIFDDLLGPLDDAYGRSQLAALVARYQPDVMVDAVNTATAISYQDVYTSAVLAERDMAALLAGRELPAEVVAHDVETLILSLAVPQLIRHISLLHRALQDAGTRLYLKVGTTGTGGMGLNIPYTHSEDRPSAKLLTKSAVAFAHTGLLFLMARTPGGPIVKEIKPGALIGYADIVHRTIVDQGEPVALYASQAEPLGAELTLRRDRAEFQRQADLQVPVVDTGENGVFTKREFEVITALGQMEYVTPEEIADLCVEEIAGRNTGRDVVASLDASVLGPSYRGGVLRHRVLDELAVLENETGVASIALGQLGPPELGKLLFEAELLARGFGTFPAVLAATPEELSRTATNLVDGAPDLRNAITSVGLPILAADGASIRRGPFLRIPEVPGGGPVPVTDADRDRWAAKGWIDLRPANFAVWQRRLQAMQDARPGKAQPGSAGVTPETTVAEGIEAGAVVAWVVANELGGWREK